MIRKEIIKKPMLALSVLLAAANFTMPAYAEETQEEVMIVETPVEEKKMYVVRDGAECYAMASDTSEIMKYLAVNAEVEVMSADDVWSTVKKGDSTYYMKNADLSEALQNTAPVQTYTENDLYVLAHTICGEAQTCDDQEQQFVASVVVNRKNDPRFPNTIEGVVFQKGQYACTRDGNYYRTPTERNWANAKYILEHGSVLPAGVVGQSGSKQGPVYVRTAHHYYCYF